MNHFSTLLALLSQTRRVFTSATYSMGCIVGVTSSGV